MQVRQCERCRAYVLAGREGGAEAVADPGTLTVDAYRQALVAGRRTFRLLRTPSGAPWRLRADSPGWTSDSDRLAAHGCAGAPLAAVAGPAAPDPRRAPATPGDGQAGLLRPDARVSPADQGRRSAATSASRRPSDAYLGIRCAACDRVIGTLPRWGFQLGEFWNWAAHVDCADAVTSGGNPSAHVWGRTSWAPDQKPAGWQLWTFCTIADPDGLETSDCGSRLCGSRDVRRYAGGPRCAKHGPKGTE